jgi:hypothetical protein
MADGERENKTIREVEKISDSIRRTLIDTRELAEEKRQMIEQVVKKAVGSGKQKGQIERGKLRERIFKELDEKDPQLAQSLRESNWDYE